MKTEFSCECEYCSSDESPYCPRNTNFNQLEEALVKIVRITRRNMTQVHKISAMEEIARNALGEEYE